MQNWLFKTDHRFDVLHVLRGVSSNIKGLYQTKKVKTRSNRRWSLKEKTTVVTGTVGKQTDVHEGQLNPISKQEGLPERHTEAESSVIVESVSEKDWSRQCQSRGAGWKGDCNNNLHRIKSTAKGTSAIMNADEETVLLTSKCARQKLIRNGSDGLGSGHSWINDAHAGDISSTSTQKNLTL